MQGMQEGWCDEVGDNVEFSKGVVPRVDGDGCDSSYFDQSKIIENFLLILKIRK